MEFTLESMFSIKDRPILLTGGTGGMGSNFAKVFAHLGAKVAILDVNQERCEEVAQEIRTEVPGADAYAAAIDITDEASVDRVFGEAYQHFGSVWGLINCAGVTHVEYLRTMKIEDWQRVMDVNCKGTLIVDKYACKYMSMNKGGRIINVSSPASRQGKPGYTPYTASKAAVDAITRVLAVEWGRRNITVNAFWPSFIVSVMTKKQWGDGLQDFINRIQGNSIQGRICSPELMVGLLVFLLSDSASYINGQIIATDGGANAGAFNPNLPQDTYENEAKGIVGRGMSNFTK